ncbi:sigma-54-dependent transcriptional regulator [Celeribacter neptunius]|uniref:DNA-binding transcriptional response regulator, NtrC family, contains REC, AAA-type ATPase, and a Fis-type DNA-binding domains n=1 Tax=Celeribacter neptunius TaxID=588602 RepID=A0A1I3NGU8_9RHOB|nr:sigma-54 dependent transcriptional regulator [Celeribacter neptunius]SFJ08402.1 DNA-binding transcriptional response regulator, NtrC family, contains REC, AAA-type ATPase, and a Fis-type DNA-binding domains [Celeribacter neptunius]
MTAQLPTVLLVDDEEHSLAAMRMALEDAFDCLIARGADEARAHMEEQFVQVIFCDHRMPGKTGVEFLTEVRERWPDTVRIIITGYTETGDMISAINEAGIYQFLTKPWHPEHLMMVAKNAADLFQLTREHDRMSLEMRYLSRSVELKLEEQRKALREGMGFETVLRAGNSPMNPVIEQARQFASFDVPVILTGEPGTGKGRIARAMHYASLRSDRPYFEINCTAVDDDILEMELFGARRGAVPGLSGHKTGLFQKADRGTLYISGIADLSPRLQLLLLRAVRDGAFRPLGAHEMMRSQVRLLIGCHRDLRHEVAEGRFNAELYYALAKVTLDVPPLRARPGDLAILAQTFLFDAASEHGKPVHGLSDDAIQFLMDYDWPGNLRELENEMVRMLIFSQDVLLGPELISRHILQATPSHPLAVPGESETAVDQVLIGTGTLKDRVEQIEMRILRETLTRLKWNKSRAANELGLSRVGLRAKIERYGIAEPQRQSAGNGEENSQEEE